jgi:hypothetical protein
MKHGNIRFDVGCTHSLEGVECSIRMILQPTPVSMLETAWKRNTGLGSFCPSKVTAVTAVPAVPVVPVVPATILMVVERQVPCVKV